jgi:dienelactone hydrolase
MVIRAGRWLAAALAAVLLAGCAGQRVHFPNLTPRAPEMIEGVLERPEGPGPFPAVVLLHGCAGLTPAVLRWAQWFRERGVLALAVDSFGPRQVPLDCAPDQPGAETMPNTVRLDDAFGALRYLLMRSDVIPDRIGAMGFSQGGVYAIAAINGPSLERARLRGVTMPTIGFRAAVAVYPGGCFSLVKERVIRPLLVLIGGADDWTVPGPCQEMVDQMRARGAEASIVVYPGAYHYFDVEDQPRAYLPDVGNRNKPGECCGATVGHDPAAAADAHRRVEEFFRRHLAR